MAPIVRLMADFVTTNEADAARIREDTALIQNLMSGMVSSWLATTSATGPLLAGGLVLKPPSIRYE